MSEKKEGVEKVHSFLDKKWLIAILVALALVIVGFIYYFSKILSDPRIYEGIKLEDFDLGQLTKEEALELIKSKKEAEIEKSIINLNHDNENYKIAIRDLGFKYDYENAVEKAYTIGRYGKNLDRLKKIRALKKENEKLELKSSFDKDKAELLIRPIIDSINKEKLEASFNFNGGNPIITEEAIGKKVDEEKLKELIYKNVYDLKDIEIPVEIIKPIRTKAQLSRINGPIGQFKTSFAKSSAARKENIRISSEAISSRGIIMPGETVSFNQTTGPRSKANGYKEAIVIEEGNFTPGTGGGVCQTSTTLYNALLRADVSIVARGPHSIPAKYVPYGQDAAVAYDYLDLKFRNDFDFPIYINSIYTGNDLTFRVYGDQNVKNYDVKIDSETVGTIAPKEEIIRDNSLAPGTRELVQSGRTGYRVNTFKTKLVGGKAGERKLITKDYYRPRNAVYKVGP